MLYSIQARCSGKIVFRAQVTCLATLPVPRQLSPTDEVSWRAVNICERISAACLLAALSPLVVGCGLVISLISRRTPLIAHRRVGWRGDTLWMLKVRTMWNGAVASGERRWRWVEYIEDEFGPEQKQAGDARVTNWFARFCRRHSIDEIPQLWHVIRGEMALVGPRPMTASEIRRYYGADAEELLQVKPGMAGLWQVSGRNLLTYAQRRQLDLEFVRDRSLQMYAKILLRTLPEICRGAGSW